MLTQPIKANKLLENIMDIQTRPLSDKNYIEVVLNGRLDMQSSEAVKSKLHQVIGMDYGVAVVDLTEVYFIDSSGLSALVSGLRAAREHEKDIVLVGLNKQAEMVFKLTMLDRVFALYPSTQAALTTLLH
jgi:anti-anti-sigma factor